MSYYVIREVISSAASASIHTLAQRVENRTEVVRDVFRIAPDIESERDRALGGSTGRVLNRSPRWIHRAFRNGAHHGPATGSVARGRYDCRHCTCPSFDCCGQSIPKTAAGSLKVHCLRLKSGWLQVYGPSRMDWNWKGLH
jgi:hypothetical protein